MNRHSVNQSSALKPIATQFKGYKFRSRLEARWAVFFNALGLRWEYEPQGFELRDGTRYLPDFYLPDQDTYVEIKPEIRYSPRRIYLAGKFTCEYPAENWRALILPGFSEFNWDDLSPINTPGFHHYVGPFMANPQGHGISDSRPCSHGNLLHESDIFEQCLHAIRNCDTVFAWIDRLDCYGTLLELGYARALDKRIFLAISEDLEIPSVETKGYRSHEPHFRNDLWFVMQAADCVVRSWSPRSAFETTLVQLPEPLKKIRQLTQWLFIAGNPHPGEYQAFNDAWDYGHLAYLKGCLTINNDPLPKQTCMAALHKARAARFEHGETPQ